VKKVFWAALGLVALGMMSPAPAADIPARPYGKAPSTMTVPTSDWTGFYIGANGGYGSTRKCWDSIAADGTLIAAEGCRGADGGVAGGQIGYRWQSGTVVFGLEGQGDWARLRGDNASSVTGNADRSRVDAFGLLTAQIGLAWNSALLYLKGGAAVTSNRYDVFTPTGSLLGSARDNSRWGGAAGLGVEYGFTPNWAVGVEYDHIFVDAKRAGFTTPAGGALATDRISGDTDAISARVNYRWGGPVVR
jgi:outer membrane immunogenic protein